MSIKKAQPVLLYLCYWGLADGLTQATAIPNVKLLLTSSKYQRIVFVTIERNTVQKNGTQLLPVSEKLMHYPLHSRNLRPNLLNKVDDFLFFPKQLKRLVKREGIGHVVARGAPAGALVYKLCLKQKLPLFVESFEPHAEYMEESGVWHKWDPRYLFEKYWEKETARVAAGLMPVSHQYQRRLEAEGIALRKVRVVPCPVDAALFRFDPFARKKMRNQYQIPDDALVAIYVGKYGGTYYDKESFFLYRQLFEVCPELYLIILSPDEPSFIYSRLLEFNLPVDRITVRSVSHHEVPAHLSAADFGLATIQPSPSKRFCSAIKVGEYWACGLPVLITPGIGDDSEWISHSGGGVVLEEDWLKNDQFYFKEMLRQLVLQQQDKGKIELLAKERRGIDHTIAAYRYFKLL